MPRSSSSSLRFRLSLLLAAVVLPGMVLQVISTVQHRELALREAERHAADLVQAISNEQGQVTAGVHELLSALSMTPVIQRQADPECTELLGALGTQHPRFAELLVLAEDGSILCGTPVLEDSAGVAIGRSAYRQALASGRFSIGEYGGRAADGRPTISFALPVAAPAGRPSAATLSIVRALSWADPYRSASGADGVNAVLIVAADGVVLARYPSADGWVGTRLPLDRRLDTTAPATVRLRWDNPAERLDRIYAFRRLPSAETTPTFVAVSLSAEVALAPADRELTRNVALLSVLLVLVVGIGWRLGTRFVLQPIHVLLQATRRLAGGELSARARVDAAEGELAELAFSFNEMAESLQRRTNETAEAFRALRRSENRYRSLIEATSSIVWATSADGSFDVDQPGWRSFTGQTWKEMRGWGWFDALHPEDRDRIMTAWSAALRDRIPYQQEMRLRRWDGEYREMLVRAVPMLDEDGQPREWIGVHTDITDRKRAEQDRAALLTREREARSEAEAANRSKSDFLAVVSHELRTPLTSIISYAELMETGDSNSLSHRQREFIDRISASAWHLTGLVEQILEFTRLEAGRVSVHLAAVDVGALVVAVGEELKPLAHEKSLEISVAVPRHPVVIRTDQGKLRQILINLVSNAIKFTEEGVVRVELQELPSQVRLGVHDSGTGIAPQHLGRIWDTFWQVESPLTRRSGGTGLGLTIVRRLTQLLGGEVTVSSVVDEGSTFTVLLPRQHSADADGAEQTRLLLGEPHLG